MKRVSLIIAGLCLATTLNLRAADEKPVTDKPVTEKPAAKRRVLTDEQKTLLKEINSKYDANKDGKLDKEERQKISSEDNDRLKKAGLKRGTRGVKGARKTEGADTTTTK